MSEPIYLVGAQTVEHAAREIASAAERIEHSLRNADLPRCVERFEAAVEKLCEALERVEGRP